MAFTFSAQASPTSTANTADTATVDITVSPAEAIISQTNMGPGDSGYGVINVSNTGTVDEYYFISADWKAGGTTSTSKATLLANVLNISVSTGGTNLYDGILKGLLDKPDSPGRTLPLTTGNEDLTVTVSLPSTAGNMVQNVDLTFDLVFVAVEA